MSENGEAAGATVLALVNDLIFASRVASAAKVAGRNAATYQRSSELLERVDPERTRLVLVDLDARGGDPVELIGRLKADADARRVSVVAFGSHVDTAALQAARDAGADRVLARSAFVRELPSLIEEAHDAS